MNHSTGQMGIGQAGHLNDRDMIQVLSDFDSQELEQRVSVHLSDCDSCRDKLESLAANPELWRQASALLSEDRVLETVAFSSRPMQRPHDLRTNENGHGYSVKDLLQPPAHPELLGRLGHYEIEREIGRGGMGVVLKARDTELHRGVAIKMMAPHLASFGVARQRFAREARSAAAILHPNVIAIHAVSTDSETPWLVMPYIVGPSLEQVVQAEGALDERDLVSFALQISGGLAAAHSQGVVHRDIKPANILVESSMGRIVITDFGLARAECDASMTQTGWFAGTPNYMSPEQARGQEVDHRSDLFSLGSVMFFMATGRLPFRAEGPMAVLEQIRDHHPATARSINPRISKTVSNLIQRLLAKQPGDRIQSASDVHWTLEQYLAHLQHPDVREKPIVKPPRNPSSNKSGRNRLGFVGVIGLALAVGGLLATAGWWALGGFDRSVQPNEASTARPWQPTTKTYQAIASEFDLQPFETFANELAELGQAITQLEQATDSMRWPSAQLTSPNGLDLLFDDLQNVDLEMRQLELLDLNQNSNPNSERTQQLPSPQK